MYKQASLCVVRTLRRFCRTPSPVGRGIPVVGIDPGTHGAFAVIDSDGEARSIKMPRTVDGEEIDYAVLAAYFEDLRRCVQHVYVEGLVKFAGRAQSGSSAIVYGFNSGAIRGILEANKFFIHIVFPTHWQRHFTARSTSDFPSRTAWKTYLRDLARGIYNNHRITKNDCDALLIARYGWHAINTLPNQS